MTLLDVSQLLLVLAAAVTAPLLAGLGRGRVPGVVVEILLGVLIGPAVLGWIDPDPFIGVLSTIGLALLMFLAGYEIDLAVIRGRPLALAGRSWLVSVVIVAIIATAAALFGHPSQALYLALPLCTTALGTLLPILSDSGVMRTPLGRHVLATGSVGEFGPIVLIALLLVGHEPRLVGLLLLVFGGMVVAALLLARHRTTTWLRQAAYRSLHSTSQLPLRLAMLLIIGFVFLADEMGLDVLLGSFAAGLIVRVAIADTADARDEVILRGKFEAIGFGVLIPVFFVVSGITIDLQALLREPAVLLVVPLVVVLFLVCRGTPVLLFYRATLARHERTVLALFASTALPLVVVVTTMGVQDGLLSGEVAAAVVVGGLLSVLLFPAIGLRVLGAATTERHPPASDAESPTRSAES